MHRTVATGALFTAGIIVGLASSEWLNAQPVPAYTTKQVIQTALENLPGQEVMIFRPIGTPGSGSRYTSTPTAMSSLSWSRASKPLRSRVWTPRS